MIKRVFLLCSILLFLSIQILTCVPKPSSVKEVMDRTVTQLYATMDESELAELNQQKLLDLLTDGDKEVLASRYWIFDVNVPVVVSLMRHSDQQVIPFWLEPAGFSKTEMLVKNEEYTYEVWQKEFDAGRVNLGINGFDNHRPHYFIAIGQKIAAQKLQISNYFPANQHSAIMKVGAFTYHDWDELVLTDVPEELNGQKLLTTIRGRAREAHLVNAFRKTPFPSSSEPDQIMLTWGADPRTTQSIQWRTDRSITEGAVRFWPKGSDEKNQSRQVSATVKLMEDRLLQNDRYVNRFSVCLENLTPGSDYLYRVGNSVNGNWSETHHFATAPVESQDFSFIYFGDTHRSPHWGTLINKAFERHPQTDFFSIGGDIVSTGLYRDDWDQLFQYSKDVISEKPLMPVPGNHDSQDGLGVWMYLDLFDLPKNGPAELEPERSYRLEYGNAVFLMIDATAPNHINTAWIAEQLANTHATWKFAIFHFPPYVFDTEHDTDYQEIREQWGSLFDKYHVDLVLSGHVHHYMRSKPIFNQKVVTDPADGTIYIISIGIPNRKFTMPEKDFVAKGFGGEMLYQTFEIDAGKLIYKTFNLEGEIRDELLIVK